MIDAAVRGWRPYALLLLLCLGLYLPGLAHLPVTDRDEARFAQATRQMLETGDLVAIRYQDAARNNKPAGIYWLQAASVALFSNAESNAIWPYRLPSLLAASGAALLVFGLGQGLVGREAAFIGAALLAASIGTVIEAHLAKTDAALLACVAAAQLALGRIYLHARSGAANVSDWRFALLFWAALGLGILIKGPVAPLVAGLTALALSLADRDARWLAALRPLPGFALLAIMVLPWLFAISSVTEGSFIKDSLGRDFLGKLIGAQESHGAPPLYYLLLLAVTFWPGALFLGHAAGWAWQQRRAPAERFLIAWAVPFWFLVELVPTKLPNYLLPAYPALALMIGSALVAASEGHVIGWRKLQTIAGVLFVLVTFVFAAALVVAPLEYGMGASLASILDLLGMGIALILAERLWESRSHETPPRRVVRLVILALVVVPIGFEFVAPRLEMLWLSRNLAQLVADYGAPKDVPVAAAGYAEPSLVFMLGTRTLLTDSAGAARHLTTARGALAVVEAREDAAFRAALAAQGWAPREIGRVAGLDYSNGRNMTLILYAGAPR